MAVMGGDTPASLTSALWTALVYFVHQTVMKVLKKEKLTQTW